jgi:hypothetical protein
MDVYMKLQIGMISAFVVQYLDFQHSLTPMYRHTGALCAMKEVNIIPDDAKSVESLKQLEQVRPYLC